MGNNQLLPFERNRYYVGKLLTSADFQAEQSYGNHKRRFLNEMMFGSGILCGLGVYSLDDLSIMVDSGVAMDGCGREIAVESSVVRGPMPTPKACTNQNADVQFGSGTWHAGLSEAVNQTG